MAIKLVIDSASDINAKEAEKLGIHMLSMGITIDGEEYMDGDNLLPEQFYDKLATCNATPKTSQINAFRWEEEFEKHINNGDEVIAITISSKLSGTYNSACNAAERFEGKVRVIDSLNACTGERLLGMLAIRLINENKTLDQIEKTLNEEKKNIKVLAVIDTLEYLKKGGRISGATAFVGKMLSIKPVIAVIDGEVKVIGKAMGSKNGYNLLTKLVADNGGIDTNMPYGAIWSGKDKTNLDKYLNDNIVQIGINADIPRYILGGTIGTHIGNGAVGISFFTKQ
ncbi:MAG: DegV family protein [Clostridia bacterium]|nr:DegV family protein [Clostridia bacterium]